MKSPKTSWLGLKEAIRKKMADSIGKRLELKLEEEGIPIQRGYHMGFILDGNRRWGKKRSKSKGEGHREGARVVREEILPFIAQLKPIKECSLFILATANLENRDEAELEDLQRLIVKENGPLIETAKKHNLRYRHAGDLEGLRKRLPRMAAGVEEMEEATKGHEGGLLVNLCLNYDVETEQAWALEGLIKKGVSLNSMEPMARQEAVFAARWIPRPADIVFRSGVYNEPRLSKFLGSRPDDGFAYLAFAKQLLPSIRPRHLAWHLMKFTQRKQNLGK